MKPVYTLLFMLSFLHHNASAQVPRLVACARHYDTTPADSTRFIYTATNRNTFNATDYMRGIIAYDTLYLYSGSSLQISSRTYADYTSNNKLASVIDQDFNTQTLQYKTVAQTKYLYSGNDLRYVISLKEDPIIRTQDTSQMTWYDYDINGNIATVHVQRSDANGNLMNHYRNSYTYNSNNQLLTKLEENPINNTLDSITRYTYHYNTTGDRDTTWVEIFDAYNTRTWRLAYRDVNQYDNNGKLVLELQQSYNSSTNSWTEYTRATSFYDPQDRKLTVHYDHFDQFSLTFVPVNRDTIIYTSNPNTVQHLLQDYDKNSGTYTNEIKRDTSFNAHDQITSTAFSYWDSTATIWKLNDHSKYYYSFPLSITETKANSIECQLYPNPATSFITVSSTTLNEGDFNIYIYDVSGRLVSKVQGNGIINKTIPVAHLSNGQYLMELNTEQGNTAKQFTVLK